ncbi:Type I restriction-modification system specificity subunit [Ligilactobacillus salivarius]|uniref:Type I restriction-modification system specificity subunit n=4 Tax=Ligilactobacillus salivarius TaxID=1624 RepID=A0A089QFK8_9LACO|nr:Type I restriction-modification system specificity subunit [Ligilactobacillus salivarius]
MMAKEEKKAPKLRFNGYTNDWEQVKLEKIATFSKGKGYSKLDLKRKGYPIFLYGQMYTNYRYKIVETSTYAILKEDAVVSNGNEIVIPSSGETSVDIARASWIAQKGIIIGSDLNIIRPTSSVHPLFLALSLSNNQVKYNLAKVAQGNSIVHLYNNNLKKVNIYFPNIVEQNKIGNILNSISNCINLHERKCEELALIKKALLQKLFPKKDEIKPEVRYKNFSDAWEQRKLGDLAEIVRGASPRPISDPKWFDDNSDIGWLRISDVTNQNGRIYYLEQHISKLGQEKTRVITEPHLLLSIAATVGKPLINYIKTGVHDGFLIFLNPKFDLEYMYQWLEMFRPKWNKYGQPGSQVNLNSNLVRKQKIALPSREEQQRISSFLKQLDSLIALHQRKLEKLKQLKKFLLQNMFI